MRHPIRYLFLAGSLFAAATLAAPALAQGLPVAPNPKSLDADDAPKAKTGRVLNADSLSEMLDGMGYDFSTNKLPSGYVIHTVTLPQDTWKFVVEVSVAPNGSLVWLIAPLSSLPDPGAVPAEQLTLLLRENWNIYPHTFCMPKEARRLYLQRAMENTNITPAKLRGAIDAMTGTIRSTAPLWDVSKWGQAPPADGKKAPDAGAAAYPDTAEGLAKFIKDLFAAAKTGKRADLAAKVKGLVIPDHAGWFKRVFGPDLGAALGEEYAAGLPQLESGLVRQFQTAVEEGQTEIKVFRFVKPDPDNATGNQNKALEGMVAKTALYSLYLTQPGEESGMHVYSFVYVDGTFRMAGKMKAATVRASGFRGLAGFEFLNPTAPAAPDVNPLAPSFAAPQFLAPQSAGLRPQAAPAPATNELDPNDFRHLAPLLSGLSPFGGVPQKKQETEPDDEPSVVGTWKGELTLATQRWKVTTTFRTNGAYRSVMEYGGYVMADKGTYTYADGVLKTEPEGGIGGTYTVTFVDEDTMRVKGGGLSITYKRQ